MRAVTTTRAGVCRPGLHLRRFGAWCGFLALALHLLIPLAQTVPSPGLASGSASLIVCKASGSPSEPTHDGEGRTDAERPFCPICQIIALGHLLLQPALAAAHPPSPSAKDRSRLASGAVPEPAGRHAWQARAPPSPA